MTQPLLTTREAALQLGFSPSSLLNWVKEGLVTPTWRSPSKRGDMRWDLADLRRQLASRHDTERFGPQPVVAVIVTGPDGVLLGRRRDGKPPWTFIAGEIEPEEDPADAAVREVKEETGLEIFPGQTIGTRVHPATGRVMIYMAGRPVRGTSVFVGDERELTEVRWASLAEARSLMPDMFSPVRNWLEQKLAA